MFYPLLSQKMQRTGLGSESKPGTALVVQQPRICPPPQGTQARFLVQKSPHASGSWPRAPQEQSLRRGARTLRPEGRARSLQREGACRQQRGPGAAERQSKREPNLWPPPRLTARRPSSRRVWSRVTHRSLTSCLGTPSRVTARRPALCGPPSHMTARRPASQRVWSPVTYRSFTFCPV